MRILHVIPTYWPAVRYGGPIRTVHSLCRHLAARGHDVHVFTTSVDGSGDSDVPIGTPVDVDGVMVTYFRSPLLRRLYWSPAMGRALAASAASFDVVHTHSVFLWPTWAAARAARAAGVPYLVSPRGMLVPELIERRSALAKRAWISLIERHNLAHAAAVHVTSDVERADLARMGLAVRRVVLVANGVDDPLAMDAGTQEPVSADIAAAVGNDAFVLALGRINWKKGLDRLLTALPPLPDVRVVIAGDDDEGEAAKLGTLAVRLGVAARVSLIPRHVEGRDKELLFARARAFVMPSLSENFGLAAVEAMRRGVPVIVNSAVGAAEIVRDAGGGLIVGDEPAALAAGIDRLLRHPDEATAMGRAGQAHVIEHCGWDRIAAAVEAVYGALR